MTPAYDPDLAPYVDLLAPLDLTDVPATRARLDDMAAARPPFVPPAGLTVEDRVAPGVAGSPDVPVVVLRPGRCGPLPALVYCHGGGFVVGSATNLVAPAELADGAGVVVVSVDYRLAPEHPFPAALDDCWAVLVWVHAHASELGIDPGRIAVGGTSAGACLAAGLALLARDRGWPPICFQLLDIPVLDCALQTPSMRTFTDTPLWTRRAAELSWRLYLGPDRGAEVSPYAAPARAEDLTGLPPTYVGVCEFDPLRDEGLDYARRLVEAGVPTEFHHFRGAFHGSAGAVPDAGSSRRIRAALVEALAIGVSHSPAVSQVSP